jgi:hypothetical protein
VFLNLGAGIEVRENDPVTSIGARIGFTAQPIRRNVCFEQAAEGRVVQLANVASRNRLNALYSGIVMREAAIVCLLCRAECSLNVEG